MANYLRARPHSPAMRLVRAVLRAATRNGREGEGRQEQPREEDILLSAVLCGGEHGISAAQYSRLTSDLLRPSRPFSRSPHVQFLEQYVKIGADIFHPEVFRNTAYFKNAVECIRTVGQYFYCIEEDQIESIARHFVARFSNRSRENGPVIFPRGVSPPGLPIRVRPILYSKCYEILDGSHRLAMSYVRGETKHRMRILGPPAVTPLQQLLLDHLWIQGRRELYQPIDSPELKDEWILVRQCADRFLLIKEFLEGHRILPPYATTYLDVACSYGWFVKAFQSLEFQTHGVEIDWSACELARLVFGLPADNITRSEVVQFLKRVNKTYDVTSCFSLMHHFVMEKGSIPAEGLLTLLDQHTETVMFFDMGQGHEEWFSESLRGWTPEAIETWIQRNSSFKNIYRLGTDSDNVAPFQRNYRRTLFACMR